MSADTRQRELQGPSWGYPTEGAYYRDASSTESLLAVRIPLFAIHAEDDPVNPSALPSLDAASDHGPGCPEGSTAVPRNFTNSLRSAMHYHDGWSSELV